MIDDENKNQQGITAYHGSPHEFDQFDTSKIGTGEGAQSYGHGLYFAEHEPIAKGIVINCQTTFQMKCCRPILRPDQLFPVTAVWTKF